MANPPPAAEPAEHAQQLTVYISEQDHWRKQPLYLAICDLLRRQGGAGATVLKGQAGFSAAGGGALHTGLLVDVAPNLPVVVIAVDSAERIAAALPALRDMIAESGGLITVTDLAGRYSTHPGLRTTHGGPLRVRQIMATQVVTVPPEMPLADVVPLLLNKSYKALPVVDPTGRVIGMVTDGDLFERGNLGLRISVLEAVQAQGEAGFEEALRALRAGGKTARDVMGSRPQAVIGPDATVAEAARLMVRENVKRLPVLDGAGRLIGIVGRSDVLKVAAHTVAAAGRTPTGALVAHARTVADVMLRDAPAVLADTPLDTVVDRLVASPDARRVVVTGGPAGREVVGIITDADLVGRVGGQARPGLLERLRAGLSLLAPNPTAPPPVERPATARDVMTSPVVTAPETLSLADAVRLMTERGVKVLPVTDAEGRFVGLVNRGALLRALLPRLG
jgi:CBS domain-containing protein